MLLVALVVCPMFAWPSAGLLQVSAPPSPAVVSPDSTPESPQEKAPPAPGQEATDGRPATQEPLFNTLIKQVSLDGQIRLRGEYRNPTTYGNAPVATRADELFLTRLRLNLDFKVTSDIDVFVQPQDERQWGQEVAVLADERNLDLHQGFVEIRNILGEPLSVKGGRMELSYGDQRLVSPLDWSNIGRAWDGAKIRYAPKDWWIEGFYTVIKDPLPAPVGLSPVPPATTGGAHDQDFSGIYFSYVGVEAHEFDLYGFFREFRDGSAVGENGATGNLIDRTLGARVKGNDLGFDYTAEAMSQTGHSASDHVLAYAYVATLGYTFDMAWKPRIGVEYDYASGDRHPTDGKRNTFDPLFPYGHYYQGFADTFSFKNGKDAALFLRVSPAENVSIHLDWHNFWLASDTDGWYNAAGGLIRRDATGQSTSHLGGETDLHTRIALGKFVKIWAGWSHVFAGPYIRQTQTTGTSRDMNWAFLQLTVDF
ncbi:MAG TPA: alginate export family protein [Planctomycetota bacterium]|nr:alginate export family protein [Planctomycetota bacterium]